MGTDGRTANGSHRNSWPNLASASWRKRGHPHFENDGRAHAQKPDVACRELKTEIRFRSFKGGARKVKGGVRGRRGRLVTQVFVKGWREVVKNDNLDWGLLKRGWDVWVRAWTQQPHVKEHKTYWKANAP